MAQAVQIQITVDGSQAQQALGQIDNALNSVGIKGQSAFKQASKAADEAHGHFQTNLDSVRLLSQEFGFRMPRAIESMLSRIPAVTTALNGVLGGLAAIAGIEIFTRVIDGLHRLYEEYVSIDAVQQKFLDDQEKARLADIGNARSVETLKERLAIETQLSQQLDSQAKTMAQQPGWFHSAPGTQADTIRAHDVKKRAKEAETLRDQLYRRLETEQANKTAIAKIDNEHKLDGELVGRKRINAELQKKIELDKQEQAFTQAQERAFLNPTAPDTGKTERDAKDALANADAAVKIFNLNREIALQIMKSRDAAKQTGMSGEALFLEKAKDDAREMAVQLANAGHAAAIGAAQTAIWDKYMADLSERQVKAQNEGSLAIQRARISGLTGGARVAAEHDLAINEINSNQALSAPEASAQREAAAINATNKLTQLQDQFADHVRSLTDERVAASLNAYQKIDAQAQKQVSDLQKLYDDDFHHAKLSDDQKLQAARNLQAGIAAIDGAARAQKQQLDARNREEDLRFDQEAAAAERRVKEDGINGWIASYRNALVEIQADEQQRLQKLQDDVTKEGLTWQEAERRRADIIRTTNANIADQNLQMQHQIANTLQEAFTNPVEFIKSRMERMFFEIVAAWIMRMNMFKGLFGQTMGSLQPGAPGAASGSGLGSILGTARSLMPGMSGTTGIVNGSPSISSSTASAVSNLSSTANTIGSLIPGASSSDASWDPLLKNAQNVSSTTSAASTSLSSRANFALGAAGVGLGGYTGYQSTLDAFKSGSPLKGAMGDASAGAAIGMVAGPVGALIGAAIGAGIGASAGLVGMVSGEAGKLSARDYYEKNVFPQLEQSMTMTSGDFQSAMSSVGNTATQAMVYMQTHFGRPAADWVQANYMQKEVTRVLASIEDKAGGGRQYLMRSAAQFHSGGVISGFGDLSTSGNEGFIHAMLDETVVNPRASALHGNVLSAMNSGASVSDVAAMYLAQARPSVAMPSASGGGDTHHWTVNALDASSFSRFLRDGGAQQIVKHVNKYASQYAGDGING